MSAIDVDVYWTDLDGEGGSLHWFVDMLASDERQRAERFHSERDRRRYIVRHGVLRELLSLYLHGPPARIRLSTNPFGKPQIEGSDLRFNLSHSHGVALYVVAQGLEVGCDIEWRDPRLACEGIAEQFFSPREARALRALGPVRRTDAFFNCWTRKEAYVKARGCGLSLPLDSFDVSLAPGEPAALLRGGEGWSIRSFEPLPGYQAAIAAAGTDWQPNLHPAIWPTLDREAKHGQMPAHSNHRAA